MRPEYMWNIKGDHISVVLYVALLLCICQLPVREKHLTFL